MQRRRQIGCLGHLDPDARTHPAAREVEHIIDQTGHAAGCRSQACADPDQLGLLLPLQQQFTGHFDRGQRTAQVVAQDRDELLAQLGGRPFARQRRFRRLLTVFAFQLQRDQVGKQLEHGQGARIGNPARFAVDRAEVAEVGAVGAQDRHGDVALDPIDAGRVVVPIDRVLACVVERDGLASSARLDAERRLHGQMVTRTQAEADQVEHGAGRPVVLRNPGDRSEPHSGEVADDAQQRRDRADAADRPYVAGDCAVVVRRRRHV